MAVTLPKDTKFIVWPDTHLPFHDQKAVDVALAVMQWYKPDKIVILGDFLDCAPVSHWLENNKRELEGLRLIKDFNLGNKLLDEMQKWTKSFYFLEGNHEDWIRQAIDKQPAFEGLIDLDVNLKFNQRPIEKHLRYNECTNIGHLWFTHGIYTCMHHAKKHVESFGRSIVYGHLHDVQTHIKVSPIDINDKHIGMSMGCLSDKNPHFMRNRPNNWVHCVGVGYARQSGDFNIDPVIISNGKASYAGKTFK